MRPALCLESIQFYFLADRGLTTRSDITQHRSLFYLCGNKAKKTMCCVPVVSSYNDGECLQLTKVSSLMTVLYLAFAAPVCPQFNQRPGSHGNDTEHLGVHDLPNTVTKCRMKRTHNSSKWINALFFSIRDFEVFRRASQPHRREHFCRKRALLTQVTVTNLFFFCFFS